jgi:hypothetical protein
MTFGAFGARTCGIDLDEDQANTLAAIFHKCFYLTQTAAQQRSGESALCRLTVGQVDTVIVLPCLTRPRHVVKPQIFDPDCFASRLNRLIDHVVGDPVSNANSQSSISGIGNRDRSLGLCPAFRAFLLTGKSNLQFRSLFFSSVEFNLLGASEVIKPARAVGDGIYDASI